jgi:hypothetical protein
MAAMLHDRRMQRYYFMVTVCLARQADISNHDDQSPSRYYDSKALSPDPVEFGKEGIVFLDVSQLPLCMAILFECPVWW